MIKPLWTLVDYVINRLPRIDPRIFPPPPLMSIIWSDQNAARVEKPYVVLNYTSVDVPDHEYYGPVDATGIAEVGSWRKAVVDMQFYAGPDSFGTASRFVTKLALEASLAKQVELDCAVGTRLMLARVPALLNESQYEDRAIYTFDFYYTERQTDFVSFIETVVVTGTYEGDLATGDDSGDITCTETITIAPIITP